VEVPNVLELDLGQAQAEIEAADLRLGTVSEEQVLGQDGTMVVEQQPSAGRQALRGSPVHLVVVIPADTVTVPEVVNMHWDDATGEISRAGLQVGGVREEESDAEPGTVLDQEPAGGRQVEPGSAVHLVVARQRVIPVPDVVELYWDLAYEEIEEAGLVVGEVTTEEVPGEEWGMYVLRQYPEGGTEVSPGSPVDLVVAAPEALVTVPNVLELDLDQAIEVIEAAGLRVGAVTEEEVFDIDGTVVVDQDPPPGEQVSRDSEVSLVVYVPAPSTIVPEVVGLDLDTALQLISERDLEVGEITEIITEDPAESGTVLDQDPAPGTRVYPFTPVNLVVATSGEPGALQFDGVDDFVSATSPPGTRLSNGW
jgi:serine/threonine-protein kinase